jgi:hypothetical protein
MPIIHIVLFEFKPSASQSQVQDVSTMMSRIVEKTRKISSRCPPQVCERMLALKDKCFHPATHENYVKSYGGGKDNSPEGLQVSQCCILRNGLPDLGRRAVANDMSDAREDSRTHL